MRGEEQTAIMGEKKNTLVLVNKTILFKMHPINAMVKHMAGLVFG